MRPAGQMVLVSEKGDSADKKELLAEFESNSDKIINNSFDKFSDIEWRYFFHFMFVRFPNKDFSSFMQLDGVSFNVNGKSVYIGNNELKELFCAKDKNYPPIYAEKIIMLIANNIYRDGLIGDMEEKYINNVIKFGTRRARCIYWVETLWTIGPLVERALNRSGLYTFALAGLKKWIGL